MIWMGTKLSQRSSQAEPKSREGDVALNPVFGMMDFIDGEKNLKPRDAGSSRSWKW
jgi:hypothetical protein